MKDPTCRTKLVFFVTSISIVVISPSAFALKDSVKLPAISGASPERPPVRGSVRDLRSHISAAEGDRSSLPPIQDKSESDAEDDVERPLPPETEMVSSIPGPDDFTDGASSSVVDKVISNVQMSVAQFRAFLNLLPSAVIVADRKGGISIVNDAATRFFGYSIREMEGFSGATVLRGHETRGMQVTALMPPEIGFVHHRFMASRLDSGEQRISRIPRPVVAKIRRNSTQYPIDHRHLSRARQKFSERMYLRSLYTQDDFMTAENTQFTPQEGFKYISALMSLGELKLGGEPYYIAFFDTSVMDRRRASVATKIAADAVGDASALSHITRGDSETFSKIFPDVVMIIVDIVGSTLKIIDQPVRTIFRDLNALFADFDATLVRYSEAVKVKTTGDGYILGVGLTCTEAVCTSLAERTLAAVNLAQELVVVAQRHSLCGHAITVRVGAHLGPVMGGILGTTKKTFDVLGSTVSLAARMESTGVPGKVQISKEVWAALGDTDKAKFARHLNPAIRPTEYTGETYLSK